MTPAFCHRADGGGPMAAVLGGPATRLARFRVHIFVFG